MLIEVIHICNWLNRHSKEFHLLVQSLSQLHWSIHCTVDAQYSLTYPDHYTICHRLYNCMFSYNIKFTSINNECTSICLTCIIHAVHSGITTLNLMFDSSIIKMCNIAILFHILGNMHLMFFLIGINLQYGISGKY